MSEKFGSSPITDTMEFVEDSPISTAKDIDVSSPADGDLSKSALRDNISKKGKNAYYYAFTRQRPGPKWDGKIEPRLLSTSSSNLSTNSKTNSVVPGSPSSNKAATMAKSNITSYAFLNETSKVKIYVNLPGVGNCREENIALEFTERSLCLTVKNYVNSSSALVKEVEVPEEMVADTAPEEETTTTTVAEEEEKEGEDRCLSFGQLFGDIENATFRKKLDKVIITLKKKDEQTWSKVIA